MMNACCVESNLWGNTLGCVIWEKWTVRLLFVVFLKFKITTTHQNPDIFWCTDDHKLDWLLSF